LPYAALTLRARLADALNAQGFNDATSPGVASSPDKIKRSFTKETATPRWLNDWTVFQQIAGVA
jgi:hypothetical protein